MFSKISDLIAAHVCYGSKTDMATTPRDIRFTPKSRPKADIGGVFMSSRLDQR
jgi:hypothetical protein